MNFEKGTLVYLPMGVRLYQMAEGHHIPVRYKTLPRPMNVLILDGKRYGYCTVLYEGENWHVPTEDLYTTRLEG
jgi:hypothetical protein